MSKNELTITLFTIGWLVPFFLILFTKKVRGSEKLLWAVLTLAGSWFTYGFYLLVAPIHGPTEEANAQSRPDESGENI
ncbi:MAG: hypothetical protein H6981_06535 [Gammaproteobacteria bacterium]|nr:hypothetical protein [Gammaproteobacteria bacterium]MCP5136440.1 hypothetical protein [Gammaproteobacteria bacterium]